MRSGGKAYGTADKMADAGAGRPHDHGQLLYL